MSPTAYVAVLLRLACKYNLHLAIQSVPINALNACSLPIQEIMLTRLIEDDDGFDDQINKPVRKPTGVWAEIVAYGGQGADEDAARLRA